jgi:hypothetical protein
MEELHRSRKSSLHGKSSLHSLKTRGHLDAFVSVRVSSATTICFPRTFFFWRSRGGKLDVHVDICGAPYHAFSGQGETRSITVDS